jgi:hypothetical protein
VEEGSYAEEKKVCVISTLTFLQIKAGWKPNTLGLRNLSVEAGCS